jgi:hypothetical protein
VSAIDVPLENLLTSFGLPLDDLRKAGVPTRVVADLLTTGISRGEPMGQVYERIGAELAALGAKELAEICRRRGGLEVLPDPATFKRPKAGILEAARRAIFGAVRDLDPGATISVAAASVLSFLEVPEADLESVCYRPRDAVFGFFAACVGAGKPLPEIYADIGHVMSYRGQPDLSAAYFRRSVETVPDRQRHDRLFHALLMSTGTTNETMLEEARRWAALYAHSVNAGRRFELDRNPEKRLRIGYTCQFFYGLGTRLAALPYMLSHDRAHFEVVAYSDNEAEDTLETADLWRSTGKLDDDAFAQLVLDDRIDILVELNGRGGHSRLDASARRIAPVQVNFGNYPATTGLPQVDYTIALESAVPREDDRFYTERVFRLDTLAIDFERCWPKDFFPPVAPAPYRTAGRLTFGCFGASVKVNESQVAAWCEMVKRVENSRFYYKSMSLSDPGAMEVYRRMFARHGVEGDRLILEGASDHRAMLELYGRVDVGLDTFPYNGGNTTLETLWQGIPVITLAGDRWVSRTGLSLMWLAGFEDFVVHSWDAYVAAAVRLAGDPEFRERFRATARARMLASPLFDMERSIRGLEAAYRAMWRRWVEETREGASRLGI